MFARVEEGHFDPSGKWVMERNWNGDQTDYGLNLPAAPTVLKVRMGTHDVHQLNRKPGETTMQLTRIATAALLLAAGGQALAVQLRADRHRHRGAPRHRSRRNRAPGTDGR